MSNVLVAYFSLSGNTEKMAQYIGEGVRISGNDAVVKKIADLKKVEDLEGFDGYIFGCPTYHRDMVEPMKTFLFLAKKVNMEGKLAGAFGSYTHTGDAPRMVFETMEYVFSMDHFSLGSFNQLEKDVGTPEGIKACQDYGRVFGETLT